MTSATIMLNGTYLDGTTPVANRATLMLSASQAVLIGERVSARYRTSALRVSPASGNSDRFIHLPDGGQLQTTNGPMLDRLPQLVRSEGMVAWLEQRWQVALAALGILAIVTGLAYTLALPWAAQRIAAYIPRDTEARMGEEALNWLDGHHWFRETRVDRETRARVLTRFDALTEDLPFARQYALAFRNADGAGANAFALPGGTIVVTDGLIELAESDDQIVAVLAHEAGHVELRHAMRHLMQTSAMSVAAATLAGDAGSATAMAATLPGTLANLRYSRELEAEADAFAIALLQRRGISPEAFASMMELLRDDAEEDDDQFGFLSTHPVSEERIAKARAAASHVEQRK